MNGVGNSFKNMTIQAPFSPPYQSMPSNVQTVKKEEGELLKHNYLLFEKYIHFIFMVWTILK